VLGGGDVPPVTSVRKHLGALFASAGCSFGSVAPSHRVEPVTNINAMQSSRGAESRSPTATPPSAAQPAGRLRSHLHCCTATSQAAPATFPSAPLRTVDSTATTACSCSACSSKCCLSWVQCLIGADIFCPHLLVFQRMLFVDAASRVSFEYIRGKCSDEPGSFPVTSEASQKKQSYKTGWIIPVFLIRTRFSGISIRIRVNLSMQDPDPY